MDLYRLTRDVLARYPDFDGHERVTQFSDAATGLEGVIAAHNANLGVRTLPDGSVERHVLGGVREWAYPYTCFDGSPGVNLRAAVKDALRLARGMAYKNACADLPVGGGKAVIITPPSGWRDRDAALRAFGRVMMIHNQGELKYNTAEDVGTSPADMNIIAETCDPRFVAGRPSGDEDGDPSPYTAFGVYHAIRAAWAHHRQDRPADLHGVTILVQGIGSVGRQLVPRLLNQRARVIVADVNAEKVAAFRAKYPLITVVPPENVYEYPCDIFTPCALGGILNEDTIPALRCSVIVGAANNQLADDSCGFALLARGITYVPDYIANAGGVVEAVEQLGSGTVNVKRITRLVVEIGPRVTLTLRRAQERRVPPFVIADEMARLRIYGSTAAA